MKHKKISREIQIELSKLSLKLPITYREISVMRGVVGQSLLNNGITELKDGTKVLPKKTYVVPVTDRVAISNRKRLFDLYKRDGIEAVKLYVEGVLSLSSENHVGKSFGGLVMESE